MGDVKQTEEALRLCEERFRMFSQATDDVLWDWDLVTNELHWGESFFSTFHYEREEVHPEIESWSSRIHPEERERVLKSIYQCIDSGGQKWADEYRFLAKGGEYLHVLDRGFLQRDADGKPVRMVGAMMDVTVRRKADEAVRCMNQELERRVQQRTQEIEASKEVLEAFSYSVSHDLRAPLRHITGFLQLLSRGNFERLDEEGKRYLAIILNAADKMGTLIDALLSFSRMGRKDLEIETVDLNSIIADTIKVLVPEQNGRAVEWTIAKMPSIEADPVLIRQAFQNLLDNALKFTRPRHPACIEVGWTDAPGERIFYVKDNGVGFDMRYVDKLFGVFQRLHTEREFEGNGVGLANVRRIVMRHGGRVWAEGELDKGAAFYFALPKTSSAQQDVESANFHPAVQI